MALPVWAGVVPMRTVLGPPERQAALGAAIQEPAYLDALLSA